MWNTPLPPHSNRLILVELARNAASKISSSGVRDEILTHLANSDLESLAFHPGLRYDEASLTVLDALYARQALAFFQKNSSLDFGRDCEAVARQTWLDTEAVCRETNSRFRSLGSTALTRKGVAVDIDSVLYAARGKIAKVLGPRVPRLSELPLAFGPGATTCVAKKNACARTKLSARPTCSTNVLPVLPEFFATWPLYTDLHGVEQESGAEEYVVTKLDVEIADGRLGFVPKNAKTHRTVLVEPWINGVIQGGYGKYISRRLRHVGVDLSDQGLNKASARLGSLTGDLATLDLSSASDLISIGLVEHLLPVDWYMALYSCRTPFAVDDETRYELAKFSSMGNGFTFPLQSLIFWALVTSVQDTFQDAKRVRVYGDDIICPTVSVPAVLEVFQYCGFSVNMEKSYWEGPFRESCGGDYYLGVNIRPLYIKDPLSMKVLFILHNYYVRNALHDLAEVVLSFIPETVRLFGPDGFGDGHLLGDWQPRHHRRDRGWSGFTFDTYKESGRRHNRLLPGDFILPAYSVYVSSPESWEAFTHDVLSGRLWAIGHTESAAPVSKGRGGIPQLALPGVVKYKRVTLYTLTP